MFYANFDIGTQMSVNQVLKFGFEFLIINGAYLRIYHILWTSAGFDSCLRKLGLYFLRISRHYLLLIFVSPSHIPSNLINKMFSSGN